MNDSVCQYLNIFHNFDIISKSIANTNANPFQSIMLSLYVEWNFVGWNLFQFDFSSAISVFFGPKVLYMNVFVPQSQTHSLTHKFIHSLTLALFFLNIIHLSIYFCKKQKSVLNWELSIALLSKNYDQMYFLTLELIFLLLIEKCCMFLSTFLSGHVTDFRRLWNSVGLNKCL